MVAECYVCQGKGSFLHLDRYICNKCFTKNIEKRVKHHLGRNLFKPNDTILVLGKLEYYFLSQVIKGMPLQITFKSKLPSDLTAFKHIILGKTLDQLDEDFLSGLFDGKLSLPTENKPFFNILAPLTDEEIDKYAQLKKISIKIKERKNAGKLFLNQLDGLKEVKYNLYRNIKELTELNQEKI